MQMSRENDLFGPVRSICRNTMDWGAPKPLPIRQHISMMQSAHALSKLGCTGEIEPPYYKPKVANHEKVYESNPVNSAKPPARFKKRKK